MSEDILREEFRDVIGYPGYEISNLGRVRSCRHSMSRGNPNLTWRFRVPYIQPKTGYPVVNLSVGGKPKTRTIHSMILEAFVGPRPEGMVSRHLDGNGRNSVLSNLEWSTQAENLMDRVAHGTMVRGIRQGNAKLHEHEITEIRRRLANGERQIDLSREFGVSQPHISRIKLFQSREHE